MVTIFDRFCENFTNHTIITIDTPRFQKNETMKQSTNIV